MECLELNLNNEIGDCSEGGGGGSGGVVGGCGNNPNPKGGGDGFIDRSKVRILLCDNNARSSEDVLTLLLKCSYQVTSVRSARQVIDALNAEGPDIDIILAEVDIPMSKGMKMLKYITRDKDLRRIPVIMMSAQDEVSIVVKCLRLGAADYLVKPLRTNELLNLWTHMWRRRRMLGLAEKNILSYEIDLVASDPSDANTTSTTLFSDDTDDRSKRSANPDGFSTHQEDEPIAAAAAAAPPPAPVTVSEPPFNHVRDCHPDVPGITDRRTGQLTSGPKKSELKVGESSAFFTYVKSSITRNNSLPAPHAEGNISQNVRLEERAHTQVEQITYNPQVHENGEAWEKSSQGDDFPSSSSFPDSLSLERSCTPPGSSDYLQQHNNYVGEKSPSHMLVPPRNEQHLEISGLGPQSAYPYYVSGVVNQVMMPSSAQMYQRNLHDLQQNQHAATYNLPHCSPHMNGVASFPYYPVSICLQPGQGPSAQSWPSFGNPPVLETKTSNVDRREAALIKFRQKRKERCFDKKIRYVNRKRLAERRPRVRGQFVRKVNGVSVDLNGQPAPADEEEDDLEDEEELASRDSSPENDAPEY